MEDIAAVKAIRTAVMVVGAVALVATGVGAVAGAAFYTAIGVSAATISAVATVSSLVSAGLTMVAKKPRTTTGSLTEYRLDPNQGIPYAMGRTFFAGVCVKRETWGVDNIYQGFTTVYSLGPIHQFENFYADRTVVPFSGSSATGFYSAWMFQTSQLGALPEAAALPTPVAGYPGWGASSKLSGLAASNWVLKFDKKAKKFVNGVPSPGMVMLGVKVYDPRQDSTFPGGSGPCRALNEGTYVYSDLPALHGLTFALGRWQNGKRRMGMGFPVTSIDIQSFVDAANIEQANGWKISGVLFSNDEKWNRLKQIGQAGCWKPVTLGGKLSCIQTAPKVSVATIHYSDLAGKARVIGTQATRDRINGLVPRFFSEQHGWQLTTSDVVRVADYVTLDGEQRTEGLDLEFVPEKNQAAQLAAYEIVNRREVGPIELNLKLRWIGLRPGDCVTVNLPLIGLSNQKCVVLSRSLDVLTGAVQLHVSTETDSKHAFALGRVGAVPPVPSLTAPDPGTVAAPGAGAWVLTSVLLSTGDGSNGVIPALQIAGAVDNPNAELIIFDYREVGSTEWIADATVDSDRKLYLITSAKPGASYEVGVRYVVRGVPGERRIIGSAALGGVLASVPWTGEWSAATNYKLGQGVMYLGRAFVSRVNANLNNAPPSTATSNGFWLVVVDKGAEGAQGVPGNPGAPGSPGATTYTWVAYANAPDGTIDFSVGAPGGRAYQGIATNKLTTIESTNPADYQWGPYTGPALFGLSGSALAVIASNNVIKNGGINNWDTGAYSTEGQRSGAFVTFQAGQINAAFMAGLNTDPTTDADFVSLDYAWYPRADGIAEIYESGVSQGTFGSYSTNTKFGIQYDDKSVKYYKEGTLVRSLATTSGRLFYFDSSIYSPGGRINSIAFGPMGATGDPGAQGNPGTPGTPGTPGATGNTIKRVWKRSGSQPATPTGNYVPSTWSADPGAPSSQAAWFSEAEISGIDGVTLVGSWTTPIIGQAATPVGSTLEPISITGRSQTTASRQFVLAPGSSRSPSAQMMMRSVSSGGTQKLRIEWRLSGGAWNTLGSEATVSVPTLEDTLIEVGGVALTNSDGSNQAYEVRAVATQVTGTMSVDQTQSYFQP